MHLATPRADRRLAPLALVLALGGLAACGGGGSTPGPQCTQASQCTVPPGIACRVPACVDGACAIAPAAAGTAAPDPTPGDCQTRVCNAAGDAVPAPDDGDLPTDGTECVPASCSAGTPIHAPVLPGTPCAGGVCDGAGQCSAACGTPADCPGVDTECRTRTCNAGRCGVSDAPAGTVVAAQVAGDCHRSECDGAGNVTAVVFDGDPPVDGNACTLDRCTAGTPSNPPVQAGTACPTGLCDGAGACQAGVNGCVPAAFVDLTAQATATVTFGELSLAYTPACLKVKAGTVVTFSGNFLFHPLLGGTVIGSGLSAVITPATDGPFVPVTSTGTTRDFTLAATGDFPFYCTVHAAAGMAGVVTVVP